MQVEEERHGAGPEKLDAYSVPVPRSFRLKMRSCYSNGDVVAPRRSYGHPEEIPLQAT